MGSDHDALTCDDCLTYAHWAWPFEKNLVRLEGAWLKREPTDGILASVTPERREELVASKIRFRERLEHVRATRLPGEDARAWIARMGVIGGPSPWDAMPEGLFWRSPRGSGDATGTPLTPTMPTASPKPPARLRWTFRDDDPSAWDDLTTTWPHDQQTCDACWAWAHWLGGRWVGPKGRRRVTTDVAEYALYYPQRFRAMRDHTGRVEAARLAAMRADPKYGTRPDE